MGVRYRGLTGPVCYNSLRERFAGCSLLCGVMVVCACSTQGAVMDAHPHLLRTGPSFKTRKLVKRGKAAC